MLKTVLISLILVIHVVILCWLLGIGGCDGKSENISESEREQIAEQPVGTSPTQEELAAAASEEADALAPLPTVAENLAKLAAPIVLQNYSADYYARPAAAVQPPQEIASQVKNCNAAALIDVTNHTLLWGYKEQSVLPIASLTKMTTVMLLMEDLRDPKKDITLDTPIRVTKAAADIGGHQVWLDPRETFTVDELLKCTLIRSANDCAYLLAEYLGGGDVSVFVNRMNQRVNSLGCRDFKFYNAHGLPVTKGGTENQGSALELAYIAERIWQCPEVIRWSSKRQEFIRENTKKPFQLDSTNKLLNVPGVCGMKTGMTNKAGFCLVATCERNGRKVIAVVLGGVNANSRDRLAKSMLEWAYSK